MYLLSLKKVSSGAYRTLEFPTSEANIKEYDGFFFVQDLKFNTRLKRQIETVFSTSQKNHYIYCLSNSSQNVSGVFRGVYNCRLALHLWQQCQSDSNLFLDFSSCIEYHTQPLLVNCHVHWMAAKSHSDDSRHFSLRHRKRRFSISVTICSNGFYQTGIQVTWLTST